MAAASLEAVMPTEVEATIVEDNVSCIDAVLPIVGQTITSNAQVEKRTAKSMAIARITHCTIALKIVASAASTAAMRGIAGMMAAVMTVVERKYYTLKTNGIAKSTSHVLTLTRTRSAV